MRRLNSPRSRAGFIVGTHECVPGVGDKRQTQWHSGEAKNQWCGGSDHAQRRRCPEESPDGKVLYYSKGFPNVVSVWRVPVEGGEEVKVLDSVNTAGQWTVGQLGIYYFSLPDKEGHSDIRLYE